MSKQPLTLADIDNVINQLDEQLANSPDPTKNKSTKANNQNPHSRQGKSKAKKDYTFMDDCPKCGGRLIVRKNYIQQRFIACYEYPKCHFTAKEGRWKKNG